MHQDFLVRACLLPDCAQQIGRGGRLLRELRQEILGSLVGAVAKRTPAQPSIHL